MFLSDRDLEYASSLDDLLIIPRPTEFDASGIDLHLDTIVEAKVWDPKRRADFLREGAVVRQSVGFHDFDYKTFAQRFAVPVPEWDGKCEPPLVYREGRSVILRPTSFFLWQTKEEVGTRAEKARFICFINGKSTRSRLGLLVHLTAPTIDAGWWGKVTLEIVNLGPFDLELKEDDAIAQLVVAMMSSPPVKQKKARGIDSGQASVTGQRGGEEPKKQQ